MKRWLGSSSLVISVFIGIGYVYRSCSAGIPVWLGGAKVIAVHTAQVRKVTGPQLVQTKGVLASGKHQDIVAPFAGRVVEIPYKTGDAVRAGVTVAIIQSNALAQRGAELEATVGAARNDSQAREEQLRSVESSAAKTRALYEQDLIARRDIEEAQRAVDAARAQLDFARAQLAQQEAMLAQLRTVQGLSRLSAPFSGVVSRLLAKPGATVAESAPIVTVADVSSLSLTVRLVGVSAGAIRVGLPAEVFNADLPQDRSAGKVVRIDELKGDGTPSLEVKIQISGAPRNFTSGMMVNAAILLEKESTALRLVRSAVMSINGKHFVYKIADGKAWLQEVTLDLAQGNEVAIKSGLVDGNIVVDDPPANLDFSRVKPSLKFRSDK